MEALRIGMGGPDQSKLGGLPRSNSEGKSPTFCSKLEPVGDFAVSKGLR